MSTTNTDVHVYDIDIISLLVYYNMYEILGYYSLDIRVYDGIDHHDDYGNIIIFLYILYHGLHCHVNDTLKMGR